MSEDRKGPIDLGKVDPIEAAQYANMNALAGGLDQLLNPEVRQGKRVRKWGFFLAVFPFGEQGRFNYISNADALDVRKMLVDLVARIDMRTKPGGHA